MLPNKRNVRMSATQPVLTAIKLSTCFLSAAAGFVWAFYTAYPSLSQGSLVISALGLPFLLYSFSRVKKIDRKDRVKLFILLLFAILFSPILPYLPVIHEIYSLLLALVFYFMFFSVAIRQNTLNAVSVVFYIAATLSVLVYDVFVVIGHDFLTERFMTGLIIIILSVIMICAALFVHATPGALAVHHPLRPLPKTPPPSSA